jgi:hypothetical protein
MKSAKCAQRFCLTIGVHPKDQVQIAPPAGDKSAATLAGRDLKTAIELGDVAC